MTDLEQMYLDFGALGYSHEIIASVTGVTVAEVKKLMLGDLGAHYQQGRHRFDYVVDKKLMEMATGGDVKSLQELNKRKRLRGKECKN